MNKNFIKETKKIPQLVNPKVIKETVKEPNVSVKLNVNVILNCVLLLSFFIGMGFFLYNCKHGCFKSTNPGPVPYNDTSWLLS